MFKQGTLGVDVNRAACHDAEVLQITNAVIDVDITRIRASAYHIKIIAGTRQLNRAIRRDRC